MLFPVEEQVKDCASSFRQHILEFDGFKLSMLN